MICMICMICMIDSHYSSWSTSFKAHLFLICIIQLMLPDLCYANPGSDLCYDANLAQPLTTVGEDLDYLDHDLSNLSYLSVRPRSWSVRGVQRSNPVFVCLPVVCDFTTCFGELSKYTSSCLLPGITYSYWEGRKSLNSKKKSWASWAGKVLLGALVIRIHDVPQKHVFDVP